MSNINPFTEIGAIVVAVVLAIMGGLLLYAGKIDTAFASSMFILAAGLLGINGALKAPSQQQQQQLGALAQQGQALTSQALSVLPTVVAATQQPAPTQPVQPAPVATSSIDPGFFVPDPNTSMAAYQTGMMPAVTPPVQP